MHQPKSNKQCTHPGCTKQARRRGTLCSRHHMQSWRERRPVLAAYHILKWNAKMRDKDFRLTVEEFAAFCSRYNYIKGKGRTAVSLTIDRIDNARGYEISNLQVLTKSENSIKGVHAPLQDCPF